MLKSFYTHFTTAVCRICLDNENLMMIPLFDMRSEAKVTLADMLNYCTDIRVKCGDELPDHICTSCKEALSSSYKFKQMAEESDNVLRQRKSKIMFKNLDELKLKIEDKTLITSDPSENDSPNISKIMKKGGSIGSTQIKKVKSEPLHSDMEVEYLDDDYFGNSPPPPKKKRKRYSKMKPRGQICIAKIKNYTEENSETFDKTDYGSLKFPIPIKFPDFLKDDFPVVVKKKTIKSVERGKVKRVVKKEYKSKEKVKHVCPICGIQASVLRAHMQTHAENKPYKCEECSNKTFSTKCHYDMHMKTHTGVKDHVCDVCGKGFFFSKSLKRHRMIHTKIKNFACSLCPLKFYVNCDLTRHMKNHMGIKNHKCETCSTLFNTKQHLDAHMRIHTGEKPYSCEVCNMAFTYKVNLNNHGIKTHGINLKFKSIYKITRNVLNEFYLNEEIDNKKKVPVTD